MACVKRLPRLTPLWLAAYAAVALVALVLRVVHLNTPHALIFDETYYAKDAWALIHSGYERAWTSTANDLWLQDSDSGMLSDPAYVVHPPLGKWLIGVGLAVFGMDQAIGWRIMPAIFGWLTVVLVMATGRKLFRSNTWGLVAGFLLGIDGMHLVMSRTALLDIFLTFFLFAGFAALVWDRDWADGRLAAARLTWWRPWRLLAGVSFGLALGVKWSALSFIAAFALLTWVWDSGRRRRLAADPDALPWWRALLDGVHAFWQVVVIAVPVYTATWLGWFMTSGGYNRHWAESSPHPAWAPKWLASWWNYHETAYRFHNQLSSEHPYSANAWTWLFQGRPTSFYYEEFTNGHNGCTVDKCSAAITDLGNPIIWWAAALSLVVVLLAWVFRRDWRAGAVFVGVLAGLGPWFAFPTRTMFTFYAVSFEPWLILGLVYAMALMVSGARTRAARSRAGWIVLWFCLLAAVVSAFFWPVWTGQVIDYSHWRLRMWFDTWI
jgi:dolichyl-phosphate-mannose--protein O-mannosyl transferase